MYTLFSGTGRMKPVVVGLANEKTHKLDGILLAVIIRELNGPAGHFSSRAVIYGGPLVEKRERGDEVMRERGDEVTRERGDEVTRERGDEVTRERGDEVTRERGDEVTRERGDEGSPIRDDSMVGGKIRVLLEELIRQVKGKSVFIQFRNFSSQEENKPVFMNSGFRYRDRLNLVVDCSSRETVMKNMSESRIRQIKKGLGQLGSWTGRQGDWETRGLGDKGTVGNFASIIEPENIGQVREFYAILYDLYKYKIKKPLPAWDFFEQFYHLSVEGKLGIIRLVKYRDRIIGGILSPVTPGKTIYEWYVCGLDHEYKEVYPSVLATWAAMDYAVENKIPNFDFMGVGIPERDYGVRDFKMRFGGRLVNYGRFARVNNKYLYFAAETGYNLLAMLKKI
jgi:hypothetical protein